MVRLIFVLCEALFWLFVLRMLLRGIAAIVAPARAAAGRPGARPAGQPRIKAAEDLVLDRVCRTYVPLASALTARVAGHEEHFCSVACRDRALAEVARAS
jgi:hypothetical protein